MNQQSRQSYADDVFSACGKAIADGQLKEEAPEVIYHLTSADVLSKIFTTRALWASLGACCA